METSENCLFLILLILVFIYSWHLSVGESSSDAFFRASAPSDEGAARVGARRAGTNSSVLIVGRLLFVWDLESHH
jgi:hypothetical protein